MNTKFWSKILTSSLKRRIPAEKKFVILAHLVEPRGLMLSHGVRHKPLFRVEGLLRFASKLACRYLRQFVFPIGAPRSPWSPKRAIFGLSLRQMYVVLQFLSNLN